MSRSHRASRVSSDFSIERILAEDGPKKPRQSLRISSQVFFDSDDGRKSYRDDSPIAPIDVQKFNVDPRSRLQFPKEAVRNSRDSRISSDYSESSSTPDSTASRNFTHARNELPWLQCTRYRPPKLPRKSSSGKTSKRRPGAHPRIPFTTVQLQILEDQYRSTAYLSRRDVLQLSTTLKLPQSRVKIWFQNRRARDRRETGISGSNLTIISEDVSSGKKSGNSPIEIFPSSNPS